MHYWMGDRHSEDISGDFFEVGLLPYAYAGDDVYLVDDVEYCVDQAYDWMNGRGDYYYDTEPPIKSRNVIVYDLC